MRTHGWNASSQGVNGRFHFAVVCLLKAIEQAQEFPGRNKYPTLRPWTRREADRFLLASGKLQDTFWKIDRAAELLDIARTKFIDFQPPSTTIEQIAATQQALRDFPLFLDSVLIYLKIFADCLADVTSQLYRRKDTIPRFGFREQKNWFTKKRPTFDPGYAEILKNQTKWFTTLSGDSNKEGLRELVIHRMVRMQLFYRPGNTPDENQVDAFLYGDGRVKVGSLLPEVQRLVQEFCISLDSYVGHFTKRIETEFGGQLSLPTVLFEFEGRLPSSWLYPQI